jgi:hypothetical protein
MNWTLGFAAAASRRLRKVFSATVRSVDGHDKESEWLTGTATVPEKGYDCRFALLRHSELRCCGRLLANSWSWCGLDVGWRHPRPELLLPGHFEGCEDMALFACEDRSDAVAALANAPTAQCALFVFMAMFVVAGARRASQRGRRSSLQRLLEAPSARGG